MSSSVSPDRITNLDLIYEARIAGRIPELVKGVLRRQIVTARAQADSIAPTPAELQAAADRFRIENNLASAEATQAWLNKNLLSIDDFEDIITHNLVADKLAQHLFGDRVKEYFYQNSLDYTKAIIYEVILADRDLAMEIFYSIQEGDLSFADVAHQYITDTELRRRGGYLGKVGRKQLRPEISAAVFAAKPPQLLEPLVTAIGVHLIQVEEIIQPELDPALDRQIRAELFNGWLDEAIAHELLSVSIDLSAKS